MASSSLERPTFVGFWVYAMLLGFLLLVPTGSVPSSGAEGIRSVLAGLGAPATLVDPQRVEMVANVLVVVPLTGAGAVLWPRTGWRDWTAAGFVVAFAVETTHALLPGRSASFSDVVANTLGAALGALVVVTVRNVRDARNRGRSRAGL